MSQENVDLAYRVVDAFNRRDIDSFLALCDPDGEYFPTRGTGGRRPYCGHDGIRSWWKSLLAFSPDFRSEIEEVRDLGGSRLRDCAPRATLGRATCPWSRPNGTSPEWRAVRRSGGAFIL